jgi:phosphate transport system substrate-binding protein
MRAALFAILMLPCLLSSCGGRSDANVIVAGSTSVQPYTEKLAEEYAHIYPDNDIDVLGGGSTFGVAAVINGTAHIGMSSRALKKDEQYLWTVEIAKDGLAIIIHPENPQTGLSLDIIRGIYTGEISSWSDIGGSDAKIHLIAREEASGTRSAFEDLVMIGAEISPKAIIQDSNGAVKQLVSEDRHAIGFISLGLVDQSVKALQVDDAEPSKANIMNGSYSLYRPFLYISDGEPEAMAKHFIDFALSPQGQRFLTNEGLITSVK